MNPFTWDGLLEREQKGRFADILVEQRDNHKRGPIKHIRREDGQIVFEMLWSAVKLGSEQEWKRLGATEISYKVSESHSIEADNEGTVTFCTPHCKVQIFSTACPGSALDPSKVVGLTGDEVRQSRAREYQLPLTATWRDIVAKMLDWASDGGVPEEDQLRIQDEAVQFA